MCWACWGWNSGVAWPGDQNGGGDGEDNMERDRGIQLCLAAVAGEHWCTGGGGEQPAIGRERRCCTA